MLFYLLHLYREFSIKEFLIRIQKLCLTYREFLIRIQKALLYLQRIFDQNPKSSTLHLQRIFDQNPKALPYLQRIFDQNPEALPYLQRIFDQNSELILEFGGKNTTCFTFCNHKKIYISCFQTYNKWHYSFLF